MDTTQNTAAARRAASPHGIDFDAVAALALAHARYLLRHWFPAGRVHGTEFKIGNIHGEPGRSLGVSLTEGLWLDFERPSHCGGDLVSLNAARLGVSQADAARDVCVELGAEMPTRALSGVYRRGARHILRPVEPAPQPELTDEQRRSIAAALRIWAERRPLRDSPGAWYLKWRKLMVPDVEDLAFHPCCPVRSGTSPAMLALLRDAVTGEPCGIHRTFIRPDGCGKDESHGTAKMTLGRAKGAVIRLVPSEDVTTGLGATEGIENGLTLLTEGWGPVWACGSANALAALPPLDGIEALTIFGDHGDAGLGAVRKCAIRWIEARKEVAIYLPREGLGDWNDIRRGRTAA